MATSTRDLELQTPGTQTCENDPSPLDNPPPLYIHMYICVSMNKIRKQEKKLENQRAGGKMMNHNIPYFFEGHHGKEQAQCSPLNDIELGELILGQAFTGPISQVKQALQGGSGGAHTQGGQVHERDAGVHTDHEAEGAEAAHCLRILERQAGAAGHSIRSIGHGRECNRQPLIGPRNEPPIALPRITS